MSEPTEASVEPLDSCGLPVPISSGEPKAENALSETHLLIESDTDLKAAIAQQVEADRCDPVEQSAALQAASCESLPLTPEPPASDSPSRTERRSKTPSPKTRPVQIAEVPPLPSNFVRALPTLEPPQQSSQFSPALLAEFELAIEHQFSNRGLLEQSLTHSSISRTRLASNERLEFLGDSIMGVVVCQCLFELFPEYPEGELTRIKSSVVSRHTCSKVSADLQFGRYLALGKGLAIHDRIPTSILAAAFESVIAAIYLDGGWEPARRFILKSLGAEINRVARSAHGYNYKSMLQQTAQKSMGQTPVYRLLDEKGPDHSKKFHISAAIGERLFDPAWGASKKEAEQNAAQNALDELKTKRQPAIESSVSEAPTE